MTSYAFFFENVKNIKYTTRHLKFSHISIFTNLRTDTVTKSVKPKKIKRTKRRLKGSIKMLLNRSKKKIPYVQVKQKC